MHYQGLIILSITHQLCLSTLRDSTHTTLRGYVLPCNHIEYYVIANITPTDPEQPPTIILWPTKPTRKCIDH